VDRLTHRINDFLRYARQKPPELKPTSAESVVQSALWQWQAQGGHEHITVKTRFDLHLPNLHIDPEQVKEALVNLLINAREAMPGSGELTIAVRGEPNGAIVMDIIDTGCGISDANVSRIFEPFFTTKEYGTGLGLTNVKRLIEDNGGTISVHGEAVKGTRFTIRFPAALLPSQVNYPLELDRQAG
jgi:signal transduction histidine kinase